MGLFSAIVNTVTLPVSAGIDVLSMGISGAMNEDGEFKLLTQKKLEKIRDNLEEDDKDISLI